MFLCIDERLSVDFMSRHSTSDINLTFILNTFNKEQVIKLHLEKNDTPPPYFSAQPFTHSHSRTNGAIWGSISYSRTRGSNHRASD